MAYPYFVAALRNGQEENQWYRPYANGKDGDGAVLTYGFMTSAPDGSSTEYGNPSLSFETYSSGEKALVKKALAIYSSLVDVTFRLVTGPANVDFGQFDMRDFAGYANYIYYNKTDGRPYDETPYGDVWLDTVEGVRSLSVILHEIGHALSMKHPFEGASKLPKAEDVTSNTVMSYTWDTDMKTLGLFDIIALQSIYGPAQRRTGNDTYVFGRDKLIWDGGGNDTIDASRSAKAVTIDLDDGSWNFAGRKTASLLSAGQVFLGDFSLIENVTGSAHKDRLSGNDLANRIKGGDGLDVITPGGGADTLFGGGGNDRFVYVTGDDISTARGFDKIRDFTKGDKIDLRAIDADTQRAGNQAFRFLGSAEKAIAFSMESGGQIAYNEAKNMLFLETTGDGIADYKLVVAGVASLTSLDFFL